MPKYVALLRGINVGGHRVKMDRLRELFEDLGLKDVSTFIASGNVIFSTRSTNVASLTRRIEKHLASSLGYDVPTFLRTVPELEAVTSFGTNLRSAADASPESIYVIFLREAPSREMREVLAGLESEMDEFRFSGREIYWLIQGKLSESPLFGQGLEKALRGERNTARNITTLRRLVAKIAE